MKTLRLILTLLLCLAVPMAGWASVMSGPLCPQRHHHAATDQHDPAASVANAGGHHHEHGGDVSTHDKACKGDHCDCGCGMGACSSAQLSLLTTQLPAFLPPVGQHLRPHGSDVAILDPRDSSPLRPPIS